MLEAQFDAPRHRVVEITESRYGRSLSVSEPCRSRKLGGYLVQSFCPTKNKTIPDIQRGCLETLIDVGINHVGDRI